MEIKQLEAHTLDTRAVRDLYEIGRALARNGHLDKATACFKKALELSPESAAIRAELIWTRRQSCDWRNFAEDDAWLQLAADSGGEGFSPFFQLLSDTGPAAALTAARRWSRTQKQVSLPPFVHPRRAEPRIRLGYLSADFRRHATSCLVRELFERHDRSRFDVIGYSIGADDGGEERRSVAAALGSLVDLHGADDATAATRIYEDGIDILVDLNGYTLGARTGILARRPAPVQVNFLGYPGTMGAGFVDYIIADAVILPPDQRQFYDECVAWMPECYQPNDVRRHEGTVSPGRTAFGLPQTGFVFCCFNALWKLTPTIFALWMRLLTATPGSVLWLLGAGGPAPDHLCREAAAHGVAPERLIFAAQRPAAEHLARQHAADLFLDTLPCTAHTTAADALWEGLPLLTCRGTGFAGRVAASLLQAALLPELVTTNLAEYEAMALRLAREPATLAALRARLRRRRGPLFDMARYASHLEAAYRRMADCWRAGEPPRCFSVDPLPIQP